MNIDNILAELRQEHETLSEAIVSLERLAVKGGKRRGRPPAWMVAAIHGSASKRRGQLPGRKNVTKKPD